MNGADENAFDQVYSKLDMGRTGAGHRRTNIYTHLMEPFFHFRAIMPLFTLAYNHMAVLF